MMVLCGKKETGEGDVEHVVKVLVKGSAQPPVALAVDDLILIKGADFSLLGSGMTCWRRNW